MTRRELLFRKNKGKQLLDDYRKKIDSFIHTDKLWLDLLSLEESDGIRKAVLGKKRKGQLADCDVEDLHQIIENLRCENGGYYVFIDEDWKYCGGFFIDDLSVIKEDFTFGTITDDLVLIKKELNRRIEISYIEDNGKYVIEYVDFSLS